MELHNRGYHINHKTVQKLMKQCGLKCEIRKRKYRSYKGQVGKIAPNIIARNFKADKPNQKWTTDVTEFAVKDQKVYLSPILDMYNGEIISYNLSLHPTFYQTMDMIDKALCKNTRQYTPNSALRSRMAVSDETIPASFEGKRSDSKHVQKR